MKKNGAANQGLKTERITIRFDAALMRRMERFEKITMLDKEDLIRSAISAALDFFEVGDSITFPFALVCHAPIPGNGWDLGPNEAKRNQGKPKPDK